MTIVKTTEQCFQEYLDAKEAGLHDLADARYKIYEEREALEDHYDAMTSAQNESSVVWPIWKA